MGACFNCMVTIDGAPNRRACLVIVDEGMQVETGVRERSR
jgi:NADH dehydrogenase/NADH:ubiquinone oxidoreductase subunit G